MSLDDLQAQLRGALDQQFAALRQHYEQAIADARRQAAEDAEREATARVEAARAETRQQAEEAARGQRDALERELQQQLEVSVQHAMNSVKKSSEMEIEALRRRVDEDVQAERQRGEAALQAAVEAERGRVQEAVAAERGRLEEGLEAERQRAQQDLEAAQHRVQQDLETERQRTQQAQQAVEAERQRLQEELEAERARAKTELETVQQLMEAEIASAQAEAAAAREAVAQANAESETATAKAAIAIAQAEANAAASTAAAQAAPAAPAPAAPSTPAALVRVPDALRGIDAAQSLSQTLDAFLQHAGAIAGRAALFLIDGDRLKPWKTVAIAEGDVQAVASSITGSDLLARAVQMGHAITASPYLPAPAFARQSADRPALAVPLVIADHPVAVLYADPGAAAPAESWVEALDLVTRHASASVALRTAARTLEVLRSDAPGAQPEPPPTNGNGEESARRYARLLVSEIKLYNEAAVRTGRQQRDLRERLRSEIDRAQRLYQERIPPALGARDQYFHQELVQTLADGDATLLGT